MCFKDTTPSDTFLVLNWNIQKPPITTSYPQLPSIPLEHHSMASTSPYANDHASPNGPHDARPTALKIIRDEGLDGKLTGKVFLITGCTSGVGVEIARAIHATGADVYITGRQADKGKQVIDKILSDGKPGKVVYLDMALDSISKVKQAAANFLDLCKILNVLICNAGKSISNI